MDDPLWKDQKMYNSCLFALHLFHKRNKYHKYLGKKKRHGDSYLYPSLTVEANVTIRAAGNTFPY